MSSVEFWLYIIHSLSLHSSNTFLIDGDTYIHGLIQSTENQSQRVMLLFSFKNMRCSGMGRDPSCHKFETCFFQSWTYNNFKWLSKNIRLWLYPKSPPIPSHSALLKGTAILSGVQNHTRCFRVHLFNPTMHRKNEYNRCTLNGLTLPIMHCESNAPNEFPHLARRWRWIFHSFILEVFVHGIIQHMYKLIINWLLGFKQFPWQSSR